MTMENNEMKKAMLSAAIIHRYFTNHDKLPDRLTVKAKELEIIDTDIMGIYLDIPEVISMLTKDNIIDLSNEYPGVFQNEAPKINLNFPIQPSVKAKEVARVIPSETRITAIYNQKEEEAAIYNNLITTASLRERHQEIIDGLASITGLIQNDKINPLDSDDKIEKYEALKGTYQNTDANVYSNQSRETRNEVSSHIYREASWVLEEQIKGYKIKLSRLNEDSPGFEETKNIIEVLESKLEYAKEASTSVTIHIVNNQFDEIKGKGME